MGNLKALSASEQEGVGVADTSVDGIGVVRGVSGVNNILSSADVPESNATLTILLARDCLKISSSYV